MDRYEAQASFAQRLYQWSQRDFFREMEEGCPLLSRIGQHNRRIGGFVSWNETLSSGERQRMALALTAEAHGMEHDLGVKPAADEVKYWNQLYYAQTTAHMDRLPPLATTKWNSSTFQPIDVDDCLDRLLSMVPPWLGKRSRRRSVVRCTRQIGDWKFITDFTYERWRKNLSCMHQFIRRDDPSKLPTPEIGPRPFPRSLLACYGIYNRTVVGVEAQADSEPMTKAMVKFAEHLVAQGEGFFEGLGVDD